MALTSTVLQLPFHINEPRHSLKSSYYEIKFKHSTLSHKLPISFQLFNYSALTIRYRILLSPPSPLGPAFVLSHSNLGRIPAGDLNCFSIMDPSNGLTE